MKCLSPPLIVVPDGDWLCPNCKQRLLDDTAAEGAKAGERAHLLELNRLWQGKQMSESWGVETRIWRIDSVSGRTGKDNVQYSQVVEAGRGGSSMTPLSEVETWFTLGTPVGVVPSDVPRGFSIEKKPTQRRHKSLAGQNILYAWPRGSYEPVWYKLELQDYIFDEPGGQSEFHYSFACEDDDADDLPSSKIYIPLGKYRGGFEAPKDSWVLLAPSWS
jgi:hypothetical protein